MAVAINNPARQIRNLLKGDQDEVWYSGLLVSTRAPHCPEIVSRLSPLRSPGIIVLPALPPRRAVSRNVLAESDQRNVAMVATFIAPTLFDCAKGFLSCRSDDPNDWSSNDGANSRNGHSRDGRCRRMRRGGLCSRQPRTTPTGRLVTNTARWERATLLPGRSSRPRTGLPFRQVQPQDQKLISELTWDFPSKVRTFPMY